MTITHPTKLWGHYAMECSLKIYPIDQTLNDSKVNLEKLNYQFSTKLLLNYFNQRWKIF